MKFSVCICVYDKDNALYFKEALESVINQSLLPNQIVLVVDGAINSQLQKVIDDFNIKSQKLNVSFDITYLKKNRGHGEARKISILKAKYPLVALMDADDLSRYERFSKQIDAFKQNSNLSIVGGQIMEIIHDTKKEVGIRSVPLRDKEIKEYLKTRCPFNQMTVMFKREDVLKVGNYIDFYHNEDYYLWVRMYLEGFEFLNLEDILVDVRINEEFYNRRGGVKYFLSEFRLQKIMYQSGIISLWRFLFNSAVRLILQVVLTDSMRGFIFKKLFRKKVKNG
jgi:glycosyltransferase involved in cell wall biosynthesis